MTRVQNSTKNIFFGLVNQIITLILTFITRTVFIKYLSIELLGVNSLFSNILTVLSIADMGFGTATLYSLYKPLIEKDEEKLSALMNFFKKIYKVIAMIIFLFGMMFLPFLNYLIKENNIENIKLYYILFLFDSFFSYLFAYRTNIMNADQKNYIIKKYTLFLNIIKSFLQILVIVMFKSFLLYIIVQILTTIGINLYGFYISKKLYPFLNNKKKLNKIEKSEIFTNVKSLFIYKIGGVILNNTDNILISVMIGLTTVGYYTNYITIINAITNITSIIFMAVTFSVGNLVVTESKEKQFNIFNKIVFFTNVLFSIITVCLFVLLNDLLICWLGNYLIDMGTVIFTVINFYILGLLNATFLFRDTTGLFNKFKYVPLITSILNIIFSIIMGTFFGLVGIIAATALSRLLTNFWYEPYVLHKTYFSEKSKKYFFNLLYNILITTIISYIVWFITKNIIVTNWVTMLYKSFIVLLITTVLIMIAHNRNPNLKYYYILLKDIFKSFKNKK